LWHQEGGSLRLKGAGARICSPLVGPEEVLRQAAEQSWLFLGGELEETGIALPDLAAAGSERLRVSWAVYSLSDEWRVVMRLNQLPHHTLVSEAVGSGAGKPRRASTRVEPDASRFVRLKERERELL